MSRGVSAATDVQKPGPVMACFLGRERIGKSFGAWVLAETHPEGRPLQVWDFDPAVHQEGSRTLSWLYPSAMKPPVVNERGRTEWLKRQTDLMIGAHLEGEPFDVICDFGGVKEMVKRFAGQFQLVSALESVGIRVVAIHVVGPELADLRFLQDVEASGAFRPKLAAIVMNEALIDPDEDPQEAFKDVSSSEVAVGFAKRGKVAFMPFLFQMPQIAGVKDKAPACSLRELTVPSTGRLGYLDAWKVKEYLDVKVPALRKQLEGCLP